MTTHRLDKNVSRKCSAKPHMSQGCQLSRSDSPQLVNSMRRRQWRRTHKHTFPVYVIGLMTWFARQQTVYFLPIYMLFIYPWSEISVVDISTLLYPWWIYPIVGSSPHGHWPVILNTGIAISVWVRHTAHADDVCLQVRQQFKQLAKWAMSPWM